MKVHIKAAAQISAQHPLSDDWFISPEILAEELTLSEDPVFSQWISPMAARRMSRIVKRAVVTSKFALEKAGLTLPDAIVTGTGLGCVEDTVRFFNSMRDNCEECLPPTYFMNSTQNTISSQIAVSLGCHGYNNTYSHGYISFQSALWDAYALVRDGDAGNALAGGFDEMVPEKYIILGGKDFFHGQPAGECAVSIVLSADGENSLCELKGMDILRNPSAERLHTALYALCDGTDTHIGAVVCPCADSLPEGLLFRNESIRIMEYGHIFGRSFTDGAFGVCMGALNCCRRGENTLLYDASDGINVSLILLKCS